MIVPFFGDQFFWGHIIEKSGAGPRPLPGKSLTVAQLVEAFRFVHKPTTRLAAERIRDSMVKEDGCAAAVHAFHKHLPLVSMHSDLEPTFAACYRTDKYNLQLSRPVAQVLVGAGLLDESELRPHITRNWQFMQDDRMHLLTHGVVEHSQKAFSALFTQPAPDFRQEDGERSLKTRLVDSKRRIAKGVSHLSIGCLSLYGEITAALDLPNTLFDPYR